MNQTNCAVNTPSTTEKGKNMPRTVTRVLAPSAHIALVWEKLQSAFPNLGIREMAERFSVSEATLRKIQQIKPLSLLKLQQVEKMVDMELERHAAGRSEAAKNLVTRIRVMFPGHTQSSLANMFSIAQSTMSRLLNEHAMSDELVAKLNAKIDDFEARINSSRPIPIEPPKAPPPTTPALPTPGSVSYTVSPAPSHTLYCVKVPSGWSQMFEALLKAHDFEYLDVSSL